MDIVMIDPSDEKFIMNKWYWALRYIKDERIRKFVVDYLKEINPQFYIKPASSTGKYHPKIARGEQGLFIHTCIAVQTAIDLLEVGNRFLFNFTDDEKDVIIAALILHDTWKYGEKPDSKYTVNNHPFIAGEKIKYTGDEELDRKLKLIKKAVVEHMGGFSYNDKETIPEPTNRISEFVHICDYLAGRKYTEEILGFKLFENDEQTEKGLSDRQRALLVKIFKNLDIDKYNLTSRDGVKIIDNLMNNAVVVYIGKLKVKYCINQNNMVDEVYRILRDALGKDCVIKVIAVDEDTAEWLAFIFNPNIDSSFIDKINEDDNCAWLSYERYED